jgi:UDP-glucose 4-epimerase
MRENLSVLVTGGAGYIGSHVVLGLRERGVPTVVVDDLSTGMAEVIPPDVPFVRGEVSDCALVDRVLRKHAVTAIIHFAGKILVAESVTRPLHYYANNVSNTVSLIEAAVEGNVGCFIFSSSAAVYGEPSATPIPEDAPVRPINPYGASKAMAERILMDAAATHGIRYAILRYFNVAGADPAGRSGQMTRGATHLIKIASEVAVGKRERISVFGTDYPTPDGTCIRDYVHVCDLADAHILALDAIANGREGVVYNCGYGKGASVLEVLRAVETVIGKPLPTDYAARRAGDPSALVADADLIRRELGWSPRYGDLETIVRSAISWERRTASG